jgi:small subunit ribosomal protein S7
MGVNIFSNRKKKIKLSTGRVVLAKHFKPYFKATLFQKIVNQLVKGGKKTVALKVLMKALSLVKIQLPYLNPISVLRIALTNILPLIELRVWIKSGKSYRIPFFVSGTRRFLLAIKWLVECARNRKERSMGDRLALEMLDAFYYKGSSVKKKIELYELAALNRPFLSFVPWDRRFKKVNLNLQKNVKKTFKKGI